MKIWRQSLLETLILSHEAFEEKKGACCAAEAAELEVC